MIILIFLNDKILNEILNKMNNKINLISISESYPPNLLSLIRIAHAMLKAFKRPINYISCNLCTFFWLINQWCISFINILFYDGWWCWFSNRCLTDWGFSKRIFLDRLVRLARFRSNAPVKGDWTLGKIFLLLFHLF